jgi:tetrahydromethanopterin S-methyltransferase subunit G
MSDPLAPARGVLIGFVIGVALWAVIISVWAVLHG